MSTVNTIFLLRLPRKASEVELLRFARCLAMQFEREIIIDTIRTADFVNILKNHTLPKPAEQANNLISFLGDYLLSPGDFYKLSKYEIIYGLLGLRIDKEYCDLEFLINSLEEQKILSVVREVDCSRRIALTLFGWQKFEELRRSITDSRKAFVAMAFVNPKNPKKIIFFRMNFWTAI